MEQPPFDPEDYAFTADLLRQHSREDNPKLFQAVCSNNLNIILSALDSAACAKEMHAELAWITANNAEPLANDPERLARVLALVIKAGGK